MMETVQVPALLLLDQGLTASTKVIWVLSRRLGLSDPITIQSATGFSRTTVLKGLAHVAATDRSKFTGQAVGLPDDLLVNPRIGSQSKLFFGYLQLTPGFQAPAGQATYMQLGRLTGAQPHTLRQAAKSLTEAGWLQVTQLNRQSVVRFSLRNPVVNQHRTNLSRVRKRIRRAEFTGEAIMREYLSLLVDSQDFKDNAYLGFLKNPFTGELMQLDRYYAAGVGFEFNGPQHYTATDQYTQDEVERQQARDFMKAGMCRTRGVALQVVQPANLSLQGMRTMVGGLLPTRDLDGLGALIALLESESRRYQAAASKWAGGASAKSHESSKGVFG